MEKINQLKKRIKDLLQICKDKNELIESREEAIRKRTSDLSPIFETEKKDVKSQLNELLKDVRVTWINVKEAFSSFKFPFDINGCNIKSFKIDPSDPLNIIVLMVNRFNLDMESLNSPYDLTYAICENANALIALLQDYISNFETRLGIYWTSAHDDETISKIKKEINEIEDEIEEIMTNEVEKCYQQIKNEVDSINDDVKFAAGSYSQNTTYSQSISLNLGFKRSFADRVTIKDLGLEYDDLYLYDYSLYSLSLNGKETNDSIIVIADEKIKERIQKVLIKRVEESYPKEGLIIVTNLDEASISDVEDNLLDYNASNETKITIPFIMSTEIDIKDNQFLKGKAFIVLVVNEEEATKFKDKVVHIFKAKETDSLLLIDQNDKEIVLDE